MNPVDFVICQFLQRSEVSAVTDLGNAGGFSGTRLWKVASQHNVYALRRWPTVHPDKERLAFIHAVQDHFVCSSIKPVPQLLRSKHGETILWHNGALWEISTWVPGTPTFHRNPNARKLKSAMELLADLHLAAIELHSWARVGTCPAIRQRVEMLDEYDAPKLLQLRSRIDDSYPQLTELSLRIIESAIRLRPACQQQLQSVVNRSTTLFPCIKDVWHDHLLFTDDMVTGIVDFGAMQIDSPAGDIARLLGSLVADDMSSWHYAIDVYRSQRPLTEVESLMVSALDWANVVYSGINWIRWLYVDRRTFPDIDQIALRLDSIFTRQRTKIESLAQP